jgi:hypothetical protein
MDADDIRALFRNYGGLRESEIQMLIERYDTKSSRDGKITYSEFFSELRPRYASESK